MNERDQNTHEDVARRLRETGVVHAPSDVREAVMRQVHAKPEGRPRVAGATVRKPASWWRQGVAPVLAYTAAAAAVVVVALFVVSNGGGGSSSGSGSSAGAGAAGGTSAPVPSTVLPSRAQLEKLPHSRVYRVPESTARSVLGRNLPSNTQNGVILVPVPRNRYQALRTLLQTAASQPAVNERHLRIRLVQLK